MLTSFRGRGKKRRGGIPAMEEDLLDYGRQGDESLIPDLIDRYAELVEATTPADRAAMAHRLSGAVEAGETTVNALNPFITVEPDFGVASSAALDFALLMPPTPEDPLAGPRYILGLARDADDQDHRLALLAGIVALGDERAASLLHGQWDLLDRERQHRLIVAWNGNLWAANVEFYLSWLESLPNEEQPFGWLAGLLARMPGEGRDTVAGGFRVYDPVARSVTFGRLERWSIAEYGTRIEARLRQLEEKESHPRVLPDVMEAWGLTPPAPVEELQGIARRARASRDPVTGLSERIESCDAIERAPLVQELLCWVYFNPMGPTHVTLGAFWLPATGDCLLGVVVAHPFVPTCKVYAHFTADEAAPGGLEAAAASLFRGQGRDDENLLSSLPSHVYLPAGSPWSLEVAKELFWLAALPSETDVPAAIAALRQHWLDPWERTRQEFRGAFAALEAEGGPSPEGAEPSRADFDHWWLLVTDPEHVRAEQREFLAAWYGACMFQQQMRNGPISAWPPPPRVEKMAAAARGGAAKPSRWRRGR